MTTYRTKTGGYTGNAWEGTNYEMGLGLSEICKRVKAQLKKEFPEVTFSVSKETFAGGGSINLYLMSAPWDAWKGEAERYSFNHYRIDENENLTDKAKEVMTRANALLDSYNYDDSDMMIDYFNTNFYKTLGIGKWDKEFVNTAK